MTFDSAAANALMYITSRAEIVFVRGFGSWLEDLQGNKYLDMVQGWAVNCLGHSPQVLVDALNTQAQTLINPSPAFFNEPGMQLAKRITDHSCFDRVFFANSGAEAKDRKSTRLNSSHVAISYAVF